MKFNENIFNGMPIGKKDINGIDICCGDEIAVTERDVITDYSTPMHNFDTNTTWYKTHENFLTVRGKISYSTDFCSFDFIPEENENRNYVRKPISDYDIIQIEKVEN